MEPLCRFLARADKPLTGMVSIRHPYLCSSLVLASPHEEGEPYKVLKDGCVGLWDTGAQRSMIIDEIARASSLPMLNDDRLITGINGSHRACEYLAAIGFSNGVWLRSFSIFGTPKNFSSRNFDLILGLDIISMGNLTLKRMGEGLKFIFRFNRSALAEQEL